MLYLFISNTRFPVVIFSCFSKRFSLFQSHTIQNLETYTQYLVSLQVFNPEGPGPNTTVLVMTDEGGKCLTLLPTPISLFT